MLTEKQLSEALTAAEMLHRREEEAKEQAQGQARLDDQDRQRQDERNAWKRMLNSGFADPTPIINPSVEKAAQDRQAREERTSARFHEFLRDLEPGNSKTNQDVRYAMQKTAERFEADRLEDAGLSEEKNAETARRSARERSRQRDREAYARMLKDL